MKVLECSQRSSHYKSMGIFPNAQGQPIHKSFVGYCPISNPYKILWVSLLPARLKRIQSKMKALKSGHSTIHWFFTRSRAANSEVNDGILPKFKHIQAFMADPVTCKNEEDPLENEGTRVVTTFLPL